MADMIKAYKILYVIQERKDNLEELEINERKILKRS